MNIRVEQRFKWTQFNTVSLEYSIEWSDATLQKTCSTIFITIITIKLTDRHLTDALVRHLCSICLRWVESGSVRELFSDKRDNRFARLASCPDTRAHELLAWGLTRMREPVNAVASAEDWPVRKVTLVRERWLVVSRLGAGV